MLLIHLIFVGTNTARAVNLQRIRKLVMEMLLVIVVHGPRGTPLIRRYGHHVFDSAVGFLRIENVRVVSLYRIRLIVLLLV